MIQARLFFVVILFCSGAIQAASLIEVIDIVDGLKQPQSKPDLVRLSEVIDVVDALKNQPVLPVFDKMQIRGEDGETRWFLYSFLRDPDIAVDKQVRIGLLKVLRQENSIKEPWMSVFHALKNVLYLLQALQTNPMTSSVAQKLYEQLNDPVLFQKLFLNGGTLQKPGLNSWLQCIQSDPNNFLQRIKQGICLMPAGVSPHLVSDIIPLNGYNEELDSFYEPEKLPETLCDFILNRSSAIAFIVPPYAGAKRFIGIVLHRIVTPMQIEVFVVDSVAGWRDLDYAMVSQLIPWYQHLEMFVRENFSLFDRIEKS